MTVMLRVICSTKALELKMGILSQTTFSPWIESACHTILLDLEQIFFIFHFL